MIHPEEIEALDEAFGMLPDFAGELRRMPGDTPWFGEVLASLLHSAVREYEHLRMGLERSTGMTAWACRNLLELNIYAQYVLQSEENARRFALNRVADGIDMFESFQSWLARNDASLVPPEVDIALQQLAEERAREEEPPPRLYSLKYLSAEVGLADEYALLTRMASKVAEPGVFGVLAGESDLDVFRPALFRAGAGHGMELYQSVKEHVDRFGAAPRG